MDAHEIVELWEATAAFYPAASRDPEASYRPADWDSLLLSSSVDSGVSSTLACNPGRLLALAGAISGFELQEEIGRGGMGVVFKAWQRSLHRDVAVKMARLEAGESEAQLARLRSGFLAEAWVTGALEHPNIVPIYELGRHADGELFLAMKLVGGQAWKTVLRERPEDTDLHLDVLLQVCNAVAFAHSRGIVHNDLKPANVMLGPFGEVLVMDWGLAVSFAEVSGDPPLRHRSAITAPCGTPAYCPPELARGQGQDVGPATDIYLLGAILYEILSGRPPHGRGDFVRAVASAITATRPPLGESLPAELRAICRRAMQAEPEARYGEVRELSEALQTYRRHKESLSITSAARQRLAACQARTPSGRLKEDARNLLYEGFAEAVAGFAQARRLWQENPHASAGEAGARLAYAQAALGQDDLGLAASQLAQVEGSSLVRAQAAGLRQELESARSRRVRAQRTARRMRFGLAAALVVIVAGLAVGLFRIDRERARAESARDVATGALERLTQEAQYNLVRQSGTEQSNNAARELLRIALEGWQQLREAAVSERTISFASGTARLQVGQLALELDGDDGRAEQEVRAAIQIFEELLQEAPQAREVLHNLGYALRVLSHIQRERGELARAQVTLEQALAIQRALVAQYGDVGALRGLTSSLDAQGILAMQRGQLETARAILEQALEIDERLLALEPNALNQRNQQVAFRRLAQLHCNQGEHQKSLNFYRRSLELAREQLRLNPDDAFAQNDLLDVLTPLADLEQILGRPGSSGALLEEALELARGLEARNPANFRAQADLCDALHQLGSLRHNQGAHAQADVLLREGLERAQRLFSRSPGLEESRLLLGKALRSLASLLDSERSLADARELYHEALELWRAAPRRTRSSLGHTRTCLEDLSELALSLGELETARRLAADGLELARHLGAADSADIFSRLSLCRSLLQVGRAEELAGDLKTADAIFSEAIERARKLRALGLGDLRAADGLVRALSEAGNSRFLAGNLPAASSLLAEADQLLRRLREDFPQHPLLRETALQLWGRQGRVLSAQGQGDEAAAAFSASLEQARALEAAYGSTPPMRREVAVGLFSLAVAREQQGADSLALLLLDEALATQQLLVEADSNYARLRHDLSLSHGVSARVCERLGQPERAWQHFEQTVALQVALVADQPGNTLVAADLSMSLYFFAMLATRLGRLERAHEFLLQAVANHEQVVLRAPQHQDELEFLYEELADADTRLLRTQLLAGTRLPGNAVEHFQLAEALQRDGRGQEALKHYELALADPTFSGEGSAFLQGARAAGMLPDARRQCLTWLEIALSGLRAYIVELETQQGGEARQELVRLRQIYQDVQTRDPAFEQLRGTPEFERLFTD